MSAGRPRRTDHLPLATELFVLGNRETTRSRIARRPNFGPPCRTGSSLRATELPPGTLDRVPAYMRMDNPDPPRADVDRDGTHLVIRAAHLRDLDVPDPRLSGRDDAELDDAVRDELLHAGPWGTPQAPRALLRDQQSRAPGGSADDLAEQHMREGPKVPDGLERRRHRGEGVDHESLGLVLIDLPSDLFPQRREALRGRCRDLEEGEPLLGHQGFEVESEPTHVLQVGLLALEHGHIHARLLALLRAMVQEVGSEDRLSGPGPPGERDQTAREEAALEHPVELLQPRRCAFVRARFRRLRHRNFGHAINLFLAFCMERATVSKKSACGARRRMWTGIESGGSPGVPPRSRDSGTSWSGISLNSGYPFANENWRP